jgi:hypothetical protein
MVAHLSALYVQHYTARSSQASAFSESNSVFFCYAMHI